MKENGGLNNLYFLTFNCCVFILKNIFKFAILNFSYIHITNIHCNDEILVLLRGKQGKLKILYHKIKYKTCSKMTVKLWKSWKLAMCKSPRLWLWLVNWFKGLIQFEEPSLQFFIWINGKKNMCVHVQKSIKSWNWLQATWFDLMHSTDLAVWSKDLIQSSSSVPLPLNGFHNPTKMISPFFCGGGALRL